eukprot:CAMPEP_0118722164 /NCGR_PEP_ID=MMETSP0800-20121206/31191_1 /TAXON_ID=210618 ORGANISM="Striatella unipunctata, Strain CCMP2910" /NCGR_SAMPLE_ID=MMETSP0800 /ASSEMBLY_ACC=CAM_ASM_000638 /LENGTH=417 /DNA_ID=CAMNT_0006630239 /DNA_START=107 /DNA_END=1360 /DNA_ORIENTATION=-
MTTESFSIHLTLTAAPSSPRITLSISKGWSPKQLHEKASDASNIPIASLKLIYRGRLIPSSNETSCVVDEFQLIPDCVVHCMGKPAAPAAAAAAPSAAATVSSASLTLAPTESKKENSSGLLSLDQALNQMRASNDASTYKTAVTTLGKLLRNITSNPMEEKYRKIKKNNPAFHRRLGGVKGAEGCILAVGFLKEQDAGEELYVLQPSEEAWPKLIESLSEVEKAVSDANNSVASSTPPVAAATSGMPPFPGGMPNMPAGMPNMPAGMPSMPAGMPNMPPGMEQAMMNMMSNPDAVRSMLQNPMVQQMMQNDPRFANNPMMREGMMQLANNPEMLSRVTSMMNNPAMRAQMEAMMAAGGGGMPTPPNMFGAPPANNSNTNNSNNNNSSNSNNGGGSDSDMTEEEMIAEAIRRSMQER